MRGRKPIITTKPCESCGVIVSKTKAEQYGRKYWTCGFPCANKLKIAEGLTSGWKTDPLRGKKDTRPCVECGLPVTRRLSQRANAKYWSCSMACSRAYQIRERMAAGTWVQPKRPRTGENVPCKTCGREFYRTPAAIRLGIGLYCGNDCHNKAQTKVPVIKNCVVCGKEMSHQPSQAAVQHCSRRCFGLGKIQRPQERMHNGKPTKRDAHGYLFVWEPEHPNKTLKGWQPEHRIVMEKTLGRYLLPDEHVDHINRDKADNRPENLQVLSQVEHAIKSAGEYRSDIAELRAELVEYRRRFGSLSEDSDKE